MIDTATEALENKLACWSFESPSIFISNLSHIQSLRCIAHLAFRLSCMFEASPKQLAQVKVKKVIWPKRVLIHSKSQNIFDTPPQKKEDSLLERF